MSFQHNIQFVIVYYVDSHKFDFRLLTFIVEYATLIKMIHIPKMSITGGNAL